MSLIWIKTIISKITTIVKEIMQTIVNVIMFLADIVSNEKREQVSKMNKKTIDKMSAPQMDIEKLLVKKVEELSLQEIDYILENVNKGTICVQNGENIEIFENNPSSKNNKKVIKNKPKITMFNGVIEFDDNIPNSFNSITKTIMDVNNMISLININDGNKEGNSIQLMLGDKNNTVLIAPNHVAAMDNITTWYPFNGCLSINKEIKNFKMGNQLSQLMSSTNIDKDSEVFFAMSNAKDGLVGVTTKVHSIYRMHIDSKLETAVISIIIPKYDVKLPISGCPIICNSTMFIANASRETDELYEIFAVSILPKLKRIAYRNNINLKSNEIEKQKNTLISSINAVDPTILFNSKQQFKNIINLSSYPHSMIINYIGTKTKYTLSSQAKIIPVVQNMMLRSDKLTTNLISMAATLIIIDYDDTTAASKIKRIKQTFKTSYRLSIIDLAGEDIQTFNDISDNQFNVISQHVKTATIKRQNFSSISSIPDGSYVTVYRDHNGLATYTGIVKALIDKNCKIRKEFINIGKKLDINWDLEYPINCNKMYAIDHLIDNDTNWRYKSAYLEYVDTPLGPLKLTEGTNKKKEKQRKLISKKLKKKELKASNIPILAIIRVIYKITSKIIIIITKIAKTITLKLTQ